MDRRNGRGIVVVAPAAAAAALAGVLLAGGDWPAALAAAAAAAAGCLICHWHARRLARALEAARLTLARQRDRLEREMTLAAEVHNALIPPTTTAGPFQVVVHYLPLERIGGDMVAYHLDAERGVARLGLGDVTGHGTAAALMVNRVHYEVQGLLDQGLPPDHILQRVNELVSRTFGGTEMLMTFAVVEVDLAAGRVAWANGGHPPPLLWHAGTGAVSLLTPQATLLGITDELVIDPPALTQPIAVGDRLVLHTDGLIDALDPEGLRFGMDRLIAVAGEILAGDPAHTGDPRPPDPEAIGAELVRRVREYTGGPLQDDVLVVTVAVKQTGTGNHGGPGFSSNKGAPCPV